jgi:hypothetical protein
MFKADQPELSETLPQKTKMLFQCFDNAIYSLSPYMHKMQNVNIFKVSVHLQTVSTCTVICLIKLFMLHIPHCEAQHFPSYFTLYGTCPKFLVLYAF